MSIHRINNPLAGLLPKRHENEENTVPFSTNNNRKRGPGPGKQAKYNYRRFNAVSSFGNLDQMAQAAEQTLLEGERHFGEKVFRIKNKSKQGKKRSEMKQQRFAWQEEHRSLKNDRITLEREIEEAVKKLEVLGLSAPLDELKMSNNEFNCEHQPRVESQIYSLRQVVSNSDPYEAAAVLSEVNETNEFIYQAMENDKQQQEIVCRHARNSVYQAMRGLPDISVSQIKKKQSMTRSMLWEKISLLKYSNDIDDIDTLNMNYNDMCTELDQHVNKIKQMKIQLKALTDIDHNDNQDNKEITVGGWLINDHDMFVKNYKECIDRGKGHQIFRQRISLSLPNVSRNILSEHVHWYEKHRYLTRQIKEEKLRWKRYITKALNDLESSIYLIYLAEKEQKKRYNDLNLIQKKNDKLHKKLNAMRKIYEEKERSYKIAQNKMKQLKEMEERRLYKLEQIRREKDKLNLNEFIDKKKKNEIDIQKQLNEEKKRLHDIYKLNEPVREERIEYRKHILAQREEERKSVMDNNERNKMAVQQSLERLKEQCLYFEKIQNMKENYDPKHVLQVTRAYDTAVKELEALRMAGFGGHSRGHAPLHGFQSKTIVGDIRFKLIESLRSAGLQATPYAQACIINMAKQLRPMPMLEVSAAFPWAPRIQP